MIPPTINGTHLLLVEHLQMMATLRGDRYGYEQFVLDYGVVLTGSPLPPRIRHGQPRLCFHNAMRLTLDHTDRYVYMEGFAAFDAFPLAAHHGWVWDLERGQVIDNTWSRLKERDQAASVYLGIPFRSVVMSRGALINRTAGLFYDWQSPMPGWLLDLSPDEFFHPLTSPYPRGGIHDSAKDPRQLRRRRSRRDPVAR